MKNTYRFLLLLFSVILVLSLAACGGGADAVTTAEETTAEPIPEPVKVDLWASGDGAYTIIRPERNSDAFMEKFLKIRGAIDAKHGVALDVSEDWLAPGKEPSAHEILIGATNRAETAKALEELPRNSYTVRVINEKLVVVGTNEELTLLAIDYFMEHIVYEAEPDVTTALNYVGTKDYAVKDVLINGVSIDDFVIVTPGTKEYNDAAQAFVDTLSTVCGAQPEIVSSRTEKAPHEIVFGSTERDPGRTYGYDDVSVYYKNGSLFFGCGSKWTAGMAVNYFVHSYLQGTGTVTVTLPEDGTAVYSASMPERAAYIADPKLMPLHWEFLWEPEPWMLDWDDKVASLCTTDPDHLFTVSHRADFLYYPENSIEAMISVWAMGGDCVEIDLHFTRDGVPIVMHDASLTRMTNCTDYMGKNGYPSSANIADWSYEQISVLRLREGQGGGTPVTPYKVPTLEDAMTVCSNRLFIILDKQAEWRYCDIEGLQTMSAPNYIYPYMEKTGCFESILISYGTIDSSAAGTLSADQALRIQKYIADKSGHKLYFYLRGWTTRGTALPYAKTLSGGSLTNSAVLVNGAFDPNNASAISMIKTAVKQYPNTMFGGWTIDTNGYDAPATWDVMYDLGMRSIMTNNMFALVQYAAGKK